jgi:pimeloyl-ACP methyl ester carboxylesterase
MDTKTLTLNGNPFFIRSWGDPDLPVLLMLHGFPEYGGAWGELAPLLSDRYHCIAPDMRGYGQSWAPEGVENYAVSELVGDMAALIGQLGRGPVTVLGHDWGAAVAYGLAMFCPDLVEKLIIMNGVHPVPFRREVSAGGAQSQASAYMNMLRADGAEDVLSASGFSALFGFLNKTMDMNWLTPAKQAEYTAEWSRQGRFSAMLNWYRAAPFKVAETGVPVTDNPHYPPEKMQVRCPHLLIWGVDDTALLEVSTEGLEEFAPDLTRVRITGADHWLHHQKPAEVAAAILDWAA